MAYGLLRGWQEVVGEGAALFEQVAVAVGDKSWDAVQLLTPA